MALSPVFAIFRLMPSPSECVLVGWSLGFCLVPASQCWEHERPLFLFVVVALKPGLMPSPIKLSAAQVQRQRLLSHGTDDGLLLNANSALLARAASESPPLMFWIVSVRSVAVFSTRFHLLDSCQDCKRSRVATGSILSGCVFVFRLASVAFRCYCFEVNGVNIVNSLQISTARTVLTRALSGAQ